MNLSGIGINKVFKTGTEPVQPYYYVSGTLDLTNAVYGGTYFFNFDNDLSYATSRDYYNFITADENSVISEVLVYVEPGFELADEQKSTYFAIGGADYKAVDNSVKVWWAAPPGFGSYNLNTINIAQVQRNGANLATITTVDDHKLYTGQLVTISCSNASFNATNVLINVTGLTTFTYTNVGGVVAPVAASGTVVKRSGAIYNGYPLSPSDLDKSPVNYFGHDGGHYPYNLVPTSSPFTTDLTNRYRYLAVTILEDTPQYPVLPILLENQLQQEQKVEEEIIVVNEEVNNETNSRSVKRNRQPREKKTVHRQLPVGDKAVNYGRLTVTLKIYPKNH